MKKVYYPTETYNENSKGFYKEFEVADDFPTLYELVEVGPSEDLKYPRFNRQTGKWETDNAKLIEDLRATINAQSTQITDLQTALVANFETEVTDNGENLPSAN